MFRQYKLRDFRLRLVMLVYAISILSVFVVGSAAEEYQNQQIMGIVIGSAAMLVLTFMDYRILLNFAWVIYTGNLVLLLLVDLIGQESNGAKRWLKLGFLRFQPSELTKLALIVFFAYFFTKYREKLNSFGSFWHHLYCLEFRLHWYYHSRICQQLSRLCSFSVC